MTLPNVKWGLLYGVILCNARAMGEFGAVSVVSGHIRGQTNTMPLHVEILYNEYNFAAAFAVASLLALAGAGDAGRSRRCVERAAARDEPPARRTEETCGMSIEVRNVSKRFGTFAALDDVSLNVDDGRAGRAARPVGLAARPRCCASSPASKCPTPGRSLLRRRGRRDASARASARSASCSSTTRCSGT